MKTPDTYERCAHCGGRGGDWVAWRGACWTVRDLAREHAGDDVLCRFCRARFDAGDWVEPGCAASHREARRRARKQATEQHDERHSQPTEAHR